MFEAVARNEPQESEQGEKKVRTSLELWQDLSSKNKIILDRAANKAGLPEDLSNFIDLYTEDNPDDTELRNAFITFNYVRDEEEANKLAKRIISLLQ